MIFRNTWSTISFFEKLFPRSHESISEHIDFDNAHRLCSNIVIASIDALATSLSDRSDKSVIKGFARIVRRSRHVVPENEKPRLGWVGIDRERPEGSKGGWRRREATEGGKSRVRPAGKL